MLYHILRSGLEHELKFDNFLIPSSVQRAYELLTKVIMEEVHLVFSYLLGWSCVEDWISDGQCDDFNNKDNCSYDGGDCCGSSAVNKYCFNCSCLSIVLYFSPYIYGLI